MKKILVILAMLCSLSVMSETKPVNLLSGVKFKVPHTLTYMKLYAKLKPRNCSKSYRFKMIVAINTIKLRKDGRLN